MARLALINLTVPKVITSKELNELENKKFHHQDAADEDGNYYVYYTVGDKAYAVLMNIF